MLVLSYYYLRNLKKIKHFKCMLNAIIFILTDIVKARVVKSLCQISVGGFVFKYDEYSTNTATFTTLSILLLKTNIYYTPVTLKLHDYTVQVSIISSAPRDAEKYAEKIDGTKMYRYFRQTIQRKL